MLKNLLYAILLGVGMAACLADQENSADSAAAESEMAAPPAAETTPTTDPADFIIDKERVGSIRVGMPIDEMRQLRLMSHHLTDTTLQLEGQTYTGYVLNSPLSAKGLLVEQACEPDCRVWRIRVRDNAYRTAQGISIGSKFAEVQEYFPISYTSMGEAGFVAVSESAGMTFILDTSQLNKSQLHRLKPEDIPANTLVTGILVY